MIIVWEIEEMKKMKRNIALMLTLCMVLTNIVPAYADEVTAHEEPVIQQEVSDIEISEIITDFETNEAASDGVSYKDETILENVEEATPANANYIEQDETPEDTDMDAFEEATPANAKYTDEKFIRETVVDGIKITLTADLGVFPEEAELWAEKIEDEATEEVIEEAVEKERDNNVNVALSYKFDIKVFVNGEEVQPDTSKGSAKVTFTLTEELSKCLDANAYHLKEEADGELTAENLGAEVKTVEEASSEETVKETVDTSKLMNTVGTDEDGVIEDDVTKKVTKLEAETDGFSYYVVEFTYNELTYELPGDSSVKLSAILETFKLEGTVTAAEVSNPELFTVTEDADEMDWTVTALQAFNTTEKLTVTLDNAQYDISVTDDSSSEKLYYKIDKDNNVLYISSEYKDEGYESFDSSQIPPWQPLEVKSGINSVIIENEIHPSSMCKWFSGCTGLRSVTGLSCIVVPKNIAEMFSGCTSLETFDLSNFNTSNVTNMSGMFKGCSGLKTIYVQNFNTEKVLSSDDMFTGCINLCGGNGTVYNLDETEKKYARIDKHDQSGYFTYGGSDQTTAYFVSKGQIVCTRTVRGGDGITVPGFAREGCDGWYIGKEKNIFPVMNSKLRQENLHILCTTSGFRKK